MDLVRHHLLAYIAGILHDDLGPSLSGLALQFSVFEGDASDRESIRAALEHTVETVRTLQYLAHGGLAARFGLRRAFSLLPYCAAPGCRERVAVQIEDLPALQGDAAQQCFEEAATAVAEHTRRQPGDSVEVRLTAGGWSMKIAGAV